MNPRIIVHTVETATAELFGKGEADPTAVCAAAQAAYSALLQARAITSVRKRMLRAITQVYPISRSHDARRDVAFDEFREAVSRAYVRRFLTEQILRTGPGDDLSAAESWSVAGICDTLVRDTLGISCSLAIDEASELFESATKFRNQVTMVEGYIFGLAQHGAIMRRLASAEPWIKCAIDAPKPTQKLSAMLVIGAQMCK